MGVLLGVEGNQVSTFEYLDRVADALQKFKAAGAVFIVPELAIDQRLELLQCSFAAFQDEIFEVLDVHFDGLHALDDLRELVETVLRHGVAPALIVLGDRLVHDMAQALHFHILHLGHHHLQLAFRFAKGKLVEAHIGEAKMLADAAQGFKILRNRFDGVDLALLAMLGEQGRHDPDIGADVEDFGIGRQHGEEMEKVTFLLVALQGADLEQRKHKQVAAKAEHRLQDILDELLHERRNLGKESRLKAGFGGAKNYVVKFQASLIARSVRQSF